MRTVTARDRDRSARYQRRLQYALRHDLSIPPGRFPDGGVWALPPEAEVLAPPPPRVLVPLGPPLLPRVQPVPPEPAPGACYVACCGGWHRLQALPVVCPHCGAVYLEENAYATAL